MPDGSRDMYVGLGVLSAPEYQGSVKRDTSAQPLIQMEWSSGVFVSGMSLGMHLSREPSLEFGPLVSIAPGRDYNGTARGAGGISEIGGPTLGPITGAGDRAGIDFSGGNLLYGLDSVPSRLQAGGFVNFYLTPDWRITNSLQYGSGRDRKGVIWNIGLQHIAAELAPNHRVSASLGVNMVNRSYNQSYFGVTDVEFDRGAVAAFYPEAGMRDMYVAARWNWLLSPRWMLTSSARFARLQDEAKKSPLVRRQNDVSIAMGLAYRF
ncbi:MAG: MipA/OmpV family protein [Pseudomonadota bacterium]